MPRREYPCYAGRSTLWVIHRWLNLDKCLVQDLFPGTHLEIKSELIPIAGRFVYVKNGKKMKFFVDG